MRLFYCTCAFLLCLPPAFAQAPDASRPIGYTVFVRGTPIGREDVSVRADTSGTTVTSEGRISAPADLVIRRAEFKYGPDWMPQSFTLEANAGGADIVLRTVVKDGNAVTEGSQGGKPVSITHSVTSQTVVHA